MNYPKKFQFQPQPPKILQLLDMLQSHDPDLQRRGARILGQTRPKAAVEELLSLLERYDGEICGWIAWVLVQIGDKTAVCGLLQRLHHPAVEVRAWSAWALGQIDDPTAVRGLLHSLSHEDEEVRWRAAAALGNTGMARTGIIAGLLQSLNDPDDYVRGRSAAALGKIGSDLALTGLTRSLEDRKSYVRYQAAYALGAIGSEAAIAALLQASTHKDAEVRCGAISALGGVRSPETIGELLPLLQDKDVFVRMRVLEALEKIGTPRVLIGLEAATRDADDYVRRRAEKALGRTRIKLAEMAAISEPPRLERPTPHAVRSSQLLIASFGEARELLLNQTQHRTIHHLISIGTPGVDPPPGCDRVPHRLRLEFSDIDTPENDPDCLMATPEDIRKAIEFAASLPPQQGTLLIHCQAGISRSSAVALAVCAQRFGAGREEESLATVTKTRPLARPNRWIVELADAALNRGGALVGALQAFDF